MQGIHASALILLLGAARAWSDADAKERREQKKPSSLLTFLFLEGLWVACVPHSLWLVGQELLEELAVPGIVHLLLQSFCVLAVFLCILGWQFNRVHLKNFRFYSPLCEPLAVVLVLVVTASSEIIGTEIVVVLHLASLGLVALSWLTPCEAFETLEEEGQFFASIALGGLALAHGFALAVFIGILRETLVELNTLIRVEEKASWVWFASFLVLSLSFVILGALGWPLAWWVGLPLLFLQVSRSSFLEMSGLCGLGLLTQALAFSTGSAYWLVAWSVLGVMVVGAQLLDGKASGLGKALLSILMLAWYAQNIPMQWLQSDGAKDRPVWVEGEQGSYEVLQKGHILAQSRNLEDILPHRFWTEEWILWHAQAPLRSPRYLVTGLYPESFPEQPMRAEFPRVWNQGSALNLMRQMPKADFFVQIHDMVGFVELEEFLRAAHKENREGILLCAAPGRFPQFTRKLVRLIQNLWRDAEVYVLEDGLYFSIEAPPQEKTLGGLNWRPRMSCEELLALWKRSGELKHASLRQALLYHEYRQSQENDGLVEVRIAAALGLYEEGHHALALKITQDLNARNQKKEASLILGTVITRPVEQTPWFERACHHDLWPKKEARQVLEVALVMQGKVAACPSLSQFEENIQNPWVRIQVLQSQGRLTEAWDQASRLPAYPRAPYARYIRARLLESLGRFREASVLN